LATLETKNPASSDQKERSTARRTPLVLGVVTAALVVPALVATLALADTSRPTPDVAATQATVEDASLTAADNPVVTATAASAKKSTKISFSLPKVVKVAERYKGSRYRFGGVSPAGFDCSGFTKYVYAKFGISLPHSASAQGRIGKRVSRASAKPGDLVITSGGAHVGIYVGKGKFIDAPMPGQVVHIRKIYTSNYFVVRVHHDTVKV
jgi:cell wall-associated NlpC family hydrolase